MNSDLRIMKKLIVFLMVAILFGSCTEHQEITPENNDVAIGEASLSKNVRVVSSKENHLLKQMDESYMVFQHDEVIADIKKGDILVSDITDKAPYGYMRKVVSVDKKEEQIVFITEHTTLDEVFAAANIQIEEELEATPGPNMRLGGDGYFVLEFSRDLPGGTGRKITGEVKIKPKFEFVWEK